MKNQSSEQSAARLRGVFQQPVKCTHVIPYDAVGGVEVAARSMSCGDWSDIAFEVEYIYEKVDARPGKLSTFNPIAMLSLAWRISRGDTDLLIVSLWRSSIVGLIAKLFHPKLILVTFLHSAKDAHYFDFIFTRLSIWFSTEVWADSEATLLGRIPCIRSGGYRIISFVTTRFQALPLKIVEPSFAFWGRVSKEKGLERSIRIFASVHMIHPNARFTIIGPDGGCLKALQELSVFLGLKESVFFLGAATHDEIRSFAGSASFYLQTSEVEGMAMSVVESMQLGLLPVVTSAGEIRSYCKDGYNAVIVSSEQNAVATILGLLSNNTLYQEMRVNAILTWVDKPLYHESIFQACNSIVGRDSANTRPTSCAE